MFDNRFVMSQAAQLVGDKKMERYGEKLKTSPVVRNTVRHWTGDVAQPIANTSRHHPFHKVSNISHKRQAAADPVVRQAAV
jgi:hypothetical protein